MSETQASIASDLFPRALGITLVAITAWIAASFISQADQEEWHSKLNQANTKAIAAVSTTLETRLETVQKLANDARLSPLFSDEFMIGDKLPKISRRAIYEFKYVNEIDHAYIFSSVYQEVLLASAGSPALPGRILAPFYTAAKNKIPRLTNIVLIGGQSYILAGHAIRSPTGKIIGYAIYTDSTRNFFKDVSQSIRSYTDMTFNAYMIEEETAIAIEGFTHLSSSMRMVNQGKTIFPIFDTYFPPQTFTNGQDEEIIAVGGFLSGLPKWKVTTEVDMYAVNATSDSMRTMLIFAFIFGTITLLLLPLKGPYSNALKNVYSKMGLIKIVEPSIDISSIERMRLDSPPPLGAPTKEQLDQNKRLNDANKPKQKEDYRPSDAVIAYNIRTGMKNKRLKLLYQPIFDTKTMQPAMYEVFLRIIDDEGKIMQPSLWLPVARKENLFSLIDETVVGVAVEKFFIRPNPLQKSLAFNISGNTFSSLEFLEQLMSASSSSHPISRHTVFELRSREIIEDKRAMSFIKECRDMGFRFSIDYFGGGPQTLKAAKTLKFDYIKLDILQFDLTSQKGQTEFVKLVKTAEAISLPIVIEKIEDERTLRLCKKLGVNYVQGYHLAEPAPDLFKG